MGKDQLSREERLAAALRDNLRRRKAQARAVDHDVAAEQATPAITLPKAPSER